LSARTDRSVLIVGPTPPPYGGQTLMIQALLDSRTTVFGDYQWSVAPVRFSRELQSTGKFQARKVLHLFGLIWRVLRVALTRRPRILYYTPAGPTRLAVLRDIVVLCVVRPFFPMTILHFHAGGVSEVYQHLPAFARPLYRRAYWHADLGIKVSRHAPNDPAELHARASIVIPNGVQDLAAGRRSTGRSEVARLLFVGLLRESKGVLVLIEALRVLADRGLKAQLHLVGELDSAEFTARLHRLVDDYGLTDQVVLDGVLVDDAKAEAYAAADILCFPTFFESETFGLVAVEAMAFGLPVVATRWRGLVDVVEHEQTGLLVAPQDPDDLADALARLILDRDEARRMGSRGRLRYEQLFTLDRHLAAMRDAFDSLTTPPRTPSREEKAVS
jgi:glycosyltransferase involved in cell wall biosynthesis